MILDVGCGISPQGDINVDLKMGANYGVTRTKANLYASVYSLPFRDRAFDIVYVNGLLHHLIEPERAWTEVLRVTENTVFCVEPNWNLFLPRDRTETHHLFRKKVIEQITRADSFNVIIRRTISTVRLGRVNAVDRTWNWFPLMLNFIVVALRKRL